MKKITTTSALLLILSFTLVFISETGTVKAESKTIVVPDDYSTIQEAIDNALSGDTVFVKSGTYVNQTLEITKPLSLVGENPENTIIYGKSPVYWPSFSFGIYFDANDVQISGFTVTTNIQVRGIYGSGDRIRIENNIIKSSDNIGIGLWGHHSIITNNNLTNGGALYCSGSSNTIIGNRISGAGATIELGGSFNAVSRNFLIEARGIIVNGDSNQINCNILKDGSVGVLLNSGSLNIVFENNITSNGGTGIHVYNASNNLVRDNYITNNGYGISLSGRFYHAENNTFYRNTLINNSYNIRIEEPYYANNWDNGSEGNYWDNYNGTDADGDGIGDTPYIIDENNQDNHPIIDYSSIPEFPSWIILPLFLVTVLFAVALKRRIRYLSAT